MKKKEDEEIIIEKWKDDSLKHFYHENLDLYDELGYEFRDPIYYLDTYQKFTFFKNEKTNFVDNKNECIHRWSPYLEGFSSTFVKNMIKHIGIKKSDTILDPFAGCGTTNVTAKMAGINTIGIEINPTMHFILTNKLNWEVDDNKLKNCIQNFKMPEKITCQPPLFLLNERQFQPEILKNLLGIKQFAEMQEDEIIKNLLLVALSSILLDCSNLKRSPSIGYTKKNYLTDDYPINRFIEKVNMMVEDLKEVKLQNYHTKAKIILGNSTEVKLEKNSVDYTITSPPYLNFFDYPGNYKLEMCWLGHALSTKDLKKIKDEMVVCDNVSRGMIRDYAEIPRVYSDPWLTYIEKTIEHNVAKRPNIRRRDYPTIVKKYFDDLDKIIENVSYATKNGGMLILVVGDSLLTDVYVPTDLILVRIAEKHGFNLEKIQITRSRRSGIRRNFKLRETITYLRKVK